MIVLRSACTIFAVSNKQRMKDLHTRENRLKQTVATLANGKSLEQMCRMCEVEGRLPSQMSIKEIVSLCRAILFPGFFGDDINACNLEYSIGVRCERLYALLADQIEAGFVMEHDEKTQAREKACRIASEFVDTLPSLRETLHTDVVATYRGDPAATGTEEVIYCYPGIRAITNYRIAHALLGLGVPAVIPRLISEMAHSETGIDIHPGAVIGKYFSIDHGTGVVIGATAIIGDNVKLYQGVTLGAKSFVCDADNNPVKGIPRHPIIGNNVVIYSNTSVLGRITVGDNAIIGGNIWVTDDVAANEKLVQAKANNILRLKQD